MIWSLGISRDSAIALKKVYCSLKMKSASVIVSLLLILVNVAHAIGNLVMDDIVALERGGFSFKKSESPSKKSVRVEVRVPPSYTFQDFGEIPFVGATYFKPEEASTVGPKLIGAEGLRLPLAHVDEDFGHSLVIRVLSGDSAGSYLEFLFHRGSGFPPMLIHVPLKAVLDHFARSAKAE